MIEKTVCDYLNDHADIPAYLERPRQKPVRFLLVEKTGSGRSNHLNTATIAVQSWAPSLYEAASLNEAVKTLMDNLIELDRISRSQLNTDYNFTNTADKQYRYQAVYDITYY